MTTLTAATPTPGGSIVPGQGARSGPLGSASAAGAGVSGADVIRIVRQRLVLILVLWLFFAALTVGFTGFMVRYYPQYRAEAMVRVKSANPVDLLNPLNAQEPRQQDVELLVKNQALLVKSPEVLRAVFDDPGIKNTSWYTWAMEQTDEDPVDLLDDIIVATPIRESNFLRVAAVWEVSKEVPILANTVVRKYLAKVNELQKLGIDEAQEQLETERTRAEKLFEGKRQEIEELRGSADVLGLPQGGPSEHLLTLEALVTELEVEMLGRKTQWENLMNARPEDLPITAELQAILNADFLIMQLERSAQDAEANLSLAEARYGKNHPMVKNARLARDAAAQRAQEERSVKLLRFQQEQIEQARRNFLEAQQQLTELKERLFEARADQRDRDAKYARYLRLMEERDLLRFQYEALLEQQNVVSMTLRQQRLVQIDVPSDAVQPKRRSSPLWEIWVPAGTVLGLALSFGIAFLIELADKSVRTPRDVVRVPVLGTIPTVDDDEVEIERVETASIDAPHSIVAEAFRNLRANLFFSAPAEQQGVLLVTSPSGGNGKTTVATNLAISIALSGRRVLLIDANFRRASLGRIFGSRGGAGASGDTGNPSGDTGGNPPNGKPGDEAGARSDSRTSGDSDESPKGGLSNILIGQRKLADLVMPTSVPGLDVLGAGPAPPNPAELLGSSYLRDIVVDARSRYDQVIFDGPPVLLVSDAMVLAGAVDGVLVVCQYRATSRGAFQRTQGQLEAINARVFGAVLNLVETRAGGYFRKVYREFYEYQEPDEEAGTKRLQLDTAADHDDGTRKIGAEQVRGEAPGDARGDERGDDLDLDEALKIDDNFDLGEDLDEPKDGS
ncbi:MAG: P-loop NTPase [Phycisphaerae bacterium]|nr:P-loop NTPase [Phycisphaerae bacterium]